MSLAHQVRQIKSEHYAPLLKQPPIGNVLGLDSKLGMSFSTFVVPAKQVELSEPIGFCGTSSFRPLS